MPAVLALIGYALISLCSVIVGISLIQQFNVSLPIPNLALTWENIRNWIYLHVVEPLRAMFFETKQFVVDELSRSYDAVSQVAHTAEQWAIVTTSQIQNAYGLVENHVIPRVSTLEQWRISAANWLHTYLQPIAEGAKALSETLRSWVNDYAVPTFTRITNDIKNVDATLKVTAKNLYDSIITNVAQLTNAINQAKTESVTRDNGLQSLINSTAQTISSQIQALDQKHTSAWRNLEQILSNTAQSLSNTITQVRNETLAREADVARTIEDEINRDKLEPEDWLLLAFLGITRKVTVEGQGQLFSIIEQAITRVRR